MSELTYKKMLEIRANRDPSYDGIFYVGVKSTRIYCLPSCKARLPLLENIQFLPQRDDGVKLGYRGCKRCKSEEFPHTAPVWIDTIVSEMKNRTSHRITEKDLEDMAQVNITTIRRIFKNRFNISLMAYYRKIRLDKAKRLIEGGFNFRDVAKDCGFMSLSGFRDAFIKEYGISPAAERFLILCK
ncbi:MAG: Ada metal-binding domain-containing protein [Candidatus Kariarchaeaceae archaeon]|jgi:AraC family transcriptional regulator of adaptative response/methylated-DNA-[protein]-cysteine methyltransferase